jgi:hypothetical protein
MSFVYSVSRISMFSVEVIRPNRNCILHEEKKYFYCTWIFAVQENLSDLARP